MRGMAQQVERTDEEAHIATRLFALLLQGYEKIRLEHQAATRPVTLTAAEVDDLISGHLSAIETDRLLQESRADDFNLLDVLQSTYKETRHSMVLAWLLDSDLRKH